MKIEINPKDKEKLEKRIRKLQDRIELKEDKIEELQEIIDKTKRCSNIFEKIKEFESEDHFKVSEDLNFVQETKKMNLEKLPNE
jgi:lipopolysaccharide biosynthesis glycosyltransferase